MKKMLLITLFVIFILTLSSCFEVKNYMNTFDEDNEKIADTTFEEIIYALKHKDELKIVDLFSKTIKKQDDLSQSASNFVNFVCGDVISFSSASEAGIGVDYETQYGKTKKVMQSSYCLTTTDNIYYIAIKECIRDDIDKNNVGILSIYIIESNNWTNDCVYRGDGKWLPGIHIVDSHESN